MKHEKYTTLSFSTKKMAEKNKEEICNYFESRIKESNICYGIDERGNTGFQVSYTLTENKTN